MSSSDESRSASPDPAAATFTSKKRKTQVDEIEVDLNLPEPPSKKAKRLLKKGKALPIKPTSDDDADDDDPTKSGKGGKAKSKRSEFGVWIGNLPWTMTRTELFKWFVESSGGAITEENITRVNLPPSKLKREVIPGEDRPRFQNKGFAYVDFDTEAVAVAAMALTETELNGRKVLIKNSSSFEGRPAPQAEGVADAVAAVSTEKKNECRKIYVGNLSFQTTEDDLWTLFDKCGEIYWVKVATFEDTGKCKGYGWVKFREAEAAEWAKKGFVRIKEAVETEDDFKDSEAEAAETKEPQGKKFTTRKWWVNRLRGRELKIEYAEDDQTRYKKRFGKDRPPREQTENGAEGKENTTPRAAPPRRAAPPPKPKGYGDEGVKSYLTGGLVKPEGKKVTF
ncbi:uncharacterized protein BCR38DRAFT_424987, partial [Pseudomassariella vexata]